MTIEFNHLNLIDLHAICDNADWLKLSTTVMDCKRCDGLVEPTNNNDLH